MTSFRADRATGALQKRKAQSAKRKTEHHVFRLSAQAALRSDR